MSTLSQTIIGIWKDSLSPPLWLLLERGEREVVFVPRSADARSAGLPPLRPPLRRWESGETPDPCLRRVDSRVGFLGGAGEVVAAAAPWNKGAGPRSPHRRCSAGRRRRVPGVVSSWIDGSGEDRCSKGGRHCGGDGQLAELLSLAPFFVVVWLLLAMPWGCWGFDGGDLVPGAGDYRRLYRSGLSSCGSSPTTTSKTTASSSARRASRPLSWRTSGCWPLQSSPER